MLDVVAHAVVAFAGVPYAVVALFVLCDAGLLDLNLHVCSSKARSLKNCAGQSEHAYILHLPRIRTTSSLGNTEPDEAVFAPALDIC